MSAYYAMVQSTIFLDATMANTTKEHEFRYNYKDEALVKVLKNWLGPKNP